MKITVRYIFAITLTFSFISFVNVAHATPFTTAGVRLNKPLKTFRDIRRTNVVPQSLDFSCGAAGLSTLFNYYLNEPITETEIITTLLQTIPLEKVRARNGFSLLDLKKFTESRGYKVTGYKMDSKFLREIKDPVLVPIHFKSYHHFVIVKGIVGDRVFIADPAAGNISMKLNKFEKMWNGNVGLVVERNKKGTEKEYQLEVKKNDFLFADYKMMSRLVDGRLIRTSINPGEFK